VPAAATLGWFHWGRFLTENSHTAEIIAALRYFEPVMHAAPGMAPSEIRELCQEMGVSDLDHLGRHVRVNEFPDSYHRRGNMASLAAYTNRSPYRRR